MRIVLVRLSALGDVVHSWPLVETIRAERPDAHLTWVVENPFIPLVEGHPAVDSVIGTATSRWRKRPLAAATRTEIGRIKTLLRELQPDVCIDPQGTTKSAIFSRWTRAPQRIGLAHPWRRERLAGLAYTERAEGAPAGNHVVASNLRLLEPLGIRPPVEAHPDGRWLLEKVRHRAPAGSWDGPYAVVLPGTGGVHKVLPTETLAEVGRGLVEIGLEVVVLWGPGEEARASNVVTSAGTRVWMAPPTDLEEMAALLGGAQLVIGGDTGPMHLAASFGVRTVGVFLASDWRRNGPLGGRTVVVSGAAAGPSNPTGTARVRPLRPVSAGEIVTAATNVLETRG
ncbi:MAG: lipopolysaccharide heptosyltransferase I [Holophagae bacterium]|jgi:heptosyltransferase-1